MPYGGRADGRFYDFLPVGPSDPIPDVNAGQLYTKRVAGVAQLFYQAEDGTVTQITPPTAFTPVDSVFTRTGNVIALLGDYAASLVTNDSGVAGATVKAALDALAALLAALTSSNIDNLSGVPGADVTAALDSLFTALGALDSGNIANISGVAGSDVTAALNWLDANKAPAGLPKDDRAASHVITSADVNRMQNFTAAGAVNLTINTGILAAENVVPWCTTGAGTMTVNGTATLRSRGSLLNSNGIYSYGAIIMLSATEALVVGDRA